MCVAENPLLYATLGPGPPLICSPLCHSKASKASKVTIARKDRARGSFVTFSTLWAGGNKCPFHSHSTGWTGSHSPS